MITSLIQIVSTSQPNSQVVLLGQGRNAIYDSAYKLLLDNQESVQSLSRLIGFGWGNTNSCSHQAHDAYETVILAPIAQT